MIKRGVRSGFLCMLCNVDGMTKEESEIHSRSPDHLKLKTKLERQIKEDDDNENRDRELLDYLEYIDPL